MKTKLHQKVLVAAVNSASILTWVACSLWIAFIAEETLTRGHVIGGKTTCIRATVLQSACIDTTSLVTNLSVQTLGVDVALRSCLNFKKITCI